METDLKTFFIVEAKLARAMSAVWCVNEALTFKPDSRTVDQILGAASAAAAASYASATRKDTCDIIRKQIAQPWSEKS